MRARIPAGLLDSGFTALGTFIVGLYAVDQIGDSARPDDLGVYALFMAAYLFVAAVTTQLVFIPAEKVTLALDAPHRTTLAAPILLRGLGPSVAVALLTGAAAVIAALQGATAELIVPFSVTAVLAGIVTPLHDHVRRLLHLAERSWAAARVSVVHAIGSVVFLFVLHGLAPSRFWVPFAALAASRLASLVVGLVAVRTPGRTAPSPEIQAALSFRALWVGGKYLAMTGAISTGNNLLVATVISALAGLDVLGYAEAARTVAQPVLVLANGLRSVMAPRSMEAAQRLDRGAATHVARVFYVMSAILATIYAALAGFDWVLNPLRFLAEEAYVVGGLVIVTIFANVLNGAAFPNRFELIGADRERSLFRAEIWANGVQLALASLMAAVAGGSVTVGAMARPVAFAGLGASRLALYRPPLDRHYAGITVTG